MHKLAIVPLIIRAMPGVLMLGFCLQPGARAARAEDFCAVTLKVSNSMGWPATSTWIELVDPSGRVVRKEMMSGPELKICDFGFGPHTLRVGTNECLPVAVSNVRAVFGAPLVLNVVLNGCGYREQMRSGCLAYFRTVDDHHDPVPRVAVSPLAADPPDHTDSFGRWQGLFGGSHDLTFSAVGFEPAKVHIECKRDEEVDAEVVMKRIGVSTQPR
jgi:hypothetical protein